MKIEFSTTILQFDKQGEKTGWSYIEISKSQAHKLNPGCKVSFRVKGTIDNYVFERVALMPMGDGSFIMPINGKIRKALQKHPGSNIRVAMAVDKRELPASRDLMDCAQTNKIYRPVLRPCKFLLPGHYAVSQQRGEAHRLKKQGRRFRHQKGCDRRHSFGKYN